VNFYLGCDKKNLKNISGINKKVAILPQPKEGNMKVDRIITVNIRKSLNDNDLFIISFLN
jgi:hypothetical protein